MNKELLGKYKISSFEESRDSIGLLFLKISPEEIISRLNIFGIIGVVKINDGKVFHLADCTLIIEKRGLFHNTNTSIIIYNFNSGKREKALALLNEFLA